MGVPTKNWAGNQRCVPQGVHLPTSTADVAAIVRRAAEAGERVKVIGGAHSFFAGSARADMEARGLPAMVRISVHCTTTADEVARTLDVVRRM